MSNGFSRLGSGVLVALQLTAVQLPLSACNDQVTTTSGGGGDSGGSGSSSSKGGSGGADSTSTGLGGAGGAPDYSASSGEYPATCGDKKQDADETAVDCGGTACVPCLDHKRCLVDTDCYSLLCGADQRCTPGTCTDGIKNEQERDVDCGGFCAPCGDGLACVDGQDCASGVCNDSKCQAPTCSDGARNQDETGVDCGGAHCAPCENQGQCLTGADCESGYCKQGQCGPWAIAVGTGDSHTCAALYDGGVACWGDNLSGELGDAFAEALSTTPVMVKGSAQGLPVLQLSVGGGHSCIVDDTGHVYCWGSNTNYELGNGAASTGLPSFVFDGASISAGEYHTCQLTIQGDLLCWGSDLWGQLGNGKTGASDPAPQQAIGLKSGVKAVAAGGSHTCAILSDHVDCWGNNAFGEVGNSSAAAAVTVPSPISGDSSSIVSLAAGWDHNCALLSNGTPVCWGNNHNGQLGDGTTNNHSAPVPVSSTPIYVSLSAGNGYTCGLTGVGTVRCWGDNVFGELGNGTNTESHSSVEVKGLPPKVVSISTTSQQACALSDQGGVYCWGRNDRGQLGNGTTANSNVAGRVIVK